jgi:hypothetical protein
LRDFHRFHPYINYLTLHNPTTSQVRALARSQLNPNKIAVVVGGDSILYGGGPFDQEWTGRLQQLLGDDYQVINFGMCGAKTQEFGATAAEFLSRNYPRLILITNLWAGLNQVGDPDGCPKFRYFFWEAYQKNWLLRDPERDARLAELARQRDASFKELKTQIRLDRGVRFRDLWSSLEYTHFSTTWCPQVGTTWYRARQRYADPNTDPLPYVGEAWMQAHQDHVMKHLRDIVASYRQASRRTGRVGTVPTDHPPWAVLQCNFRQCFPEACRRRTLVLVNHLSPYYLNQLDAAERADFFAMSARLAQAVEETGTAVTEIGKDYPLPCYRDYAHFSLEGGRRLAEDTSRKVRELANRLGYLDCGDNAREVAPPAATGAGRCPR